MSLISYIKKKRRARRDRREYRLKLKILFALLKCPKADPHDLRYYVIGINEILYPRPDEAPAPNT